MRELTVRDMLYETPGKETRKKTAVATVVSLLVIMVFLCYIVKLFSESGQLDSRYWFFFTKLTTWKFLFEGILGTLEASLLAGTSALAIGFVFMCMRICVYKPLNYIGIALVEFTRGVPTLLFIYFFFLDVPKMGINLPTVWRISLPVAISASGMVSEVLRSGVNAVPKGQREAALSIGMREINVFLKIIFPQAVRYIIPALVSDLVIVVKDTTFSYILSFPDLMQNAKVLISNYDALLSVYLVAGVIYILINYFLNRISVSLAKRSGMTPVVGR
ncbi:amino acid ABC transporter permease [Oribacterium sp. WCC10]|uniref:amino acid ABC transporter permease n=1 Tax=Oribacterium sp. WCC10 TaxID=1855343 RepID=UPI0008DF1EE6|nr:amino acid ABC transporter permease [Oribacterium sp. WCC10]SFG77589.1 amino acid ABC transporter membrane protein 2, PAAT family [Oribacterium sp. WCC10]